MTDYYEVLQVSRTASDEVIRGAYRSLMKVHHPDRGGDPLEAAAVHEAYENLSDPRRRAAYDAVLNADKPFYASPFGDPAESETGLRNVPGSASPPFVVPPPATAPPSAPRRQTGAQTQTQYFAPPGMPAGGPMPGWWRVVRGGSVHSVISGVIWVLLTVSPLIMSVGAAVFEAAAWDTVGSNTAILMLPALLSLLIGVRRARTRRLALYIIWILLGLGMALLVGQPWAAASVATLGTAAFIIAWCACFVWAAESRARAVRRGIMSR